MQNITLDQLCKYVTAFVEQQHTIECPPHTPLPPMLRIRAIREVCDGIWWHSLDRAVALASPPDGRAS